MKTRKILIQTAGWYGAIIILLNFFLVSFGYLSPRSLFYLIGNGTGALGIVLQASSRKDYPSMFLNIVYGLVAVVAIFKVLL